MPCGDTTFVPHNRFTTREANAFYSLDLVQPVVHPYELWGPLKDCPWYNFYSVFPTRQWSEFEDYIKIYAISGEPYDPYDTDKRLPNLQSAQSAAGRHRTAGPWDPWSTSIRPLISQAMLLACIAQLTGRLSLSWTLMSSGLKLCSCG